MEKDVKDLTKEELLDPMFIPSIFEGYPDETERQPILLEILNVAKDLRVVGKVKNAISKYTHEIKVINNTVNAILVLNPQGAPEVSTENFVTVMETDPRIKNLFYYDEFIQQPINTKTKTWWSDNDDKELRCLIEKEYGIYNSNKYYDAFGKVLMNRRVHPIKNIIENEKWDGTPRIDKFLINIMGCDDDDYSREVSRMIFYGGINRLYHPGCKFDYMPILIGKQGTAKSSLISWLALKDDYYKEVSTIEGKDGMEILDGAWICEMAELLAMVRSKEVESMKSYLSRCSDKFRKSYDRRTSINPRTCIFIGTTNSYNFLTDQSGNRRYLPIEVHSNGSVIYEHKDLIKEYILQCWREALVLMNEGKTYLSIPVEYLGNLNNKQQEYKMDDPMTNDVINYLDTLEVGEKVCTKDIWVKARKQPQFTLSRAYSDKICSIINSLDDWKKLSSFRHKDYGMQKGWIKIEPKTDETPFNPMLDSVKKYNDLD